MEHMQLSLFELCRSPKVNAASARAAVRGRVAVLGLILLAGALPCTAHPLWFNSTVRYESTQPTAGPDAIANWIGASFDAQNLCGSGVNADGGADNGGANDECTYLAGDRPIQGQTFTTGSAANGYDLHAVTVRMAGYTNNNARGSNRTWWDLNFTNGPLLVEIHEIDGSTLNRMSIQAFNSGTEGNPGSGGSANGAGDYITFELPFGVHLDPNTLYGFDLVIGEGNTSYFELLGIDSDVYVGGNAYSRSGTTITHLAGDRVFMLDRVAATEPWQPFQHPGTLHTQADLDRMATKVAASAEPWAESFGILTDSPYAQTWWGPAAVENIVRGGSGNNYTRSQQDAQAIYSLALRWHITGDTTYADRAVLIANAWSSTLTGITGDTNASLASGICGYLFAIGGELLSTYPGWAPADKQAYQNMLLNVFYPRNVDFLWRHHGTPVNKGGNTHYRLNWDSANMASMAAIGIMCDNKAIYDQAVDYFKYGTGNGRIERAAWYLHPKGGAQTEEVGRDQPHNVLGWLQLGYLCQMAWNQGDDLFAYSNYRYLRAMEYITKYNLFEDVPFVYHRNCDITYTETLSTSNRGTLANIYELVTNHYVNIRGMSAPYCEQAAEMNRPEPWPNTAWHPSVVDWLGLGTLTFTRDDVADSVPPSDMIAHWSDGRVTLSWLGSAGAIGYRVKRSTESGGPYTLQATTLPDELHCVDLNVVDGQTYYYVVEGYGRRDSWLSDELVVRQQLKSYYPLDGDTKNIAFDSSDVNEVTNCIDGPDTPIDPVSLCVNVDMNNDTDGDMHDFASLQRSAGVTPHGSGDALLHGGSTGLPSYVPGYDSGLAVCLDGVDDYVELPVGIGNYQDITVATWVYWNGGSNFQRIFDFGSEIEKYMYLTPSTGSACRFKISTSRGNEGTGTLEGPALPNGQWVHVAVTLDGDVGTLYVNGSPVDTETIDEVDPLFGQPYCYIGRSMWNNDPLFDGCIDDFRIYNYALSGADVNALWSAGAP